MAATREVVAAGDRAAIARMAYQLWEEEGRPDGSDLRHWLEAESRWRLEHVEGTPSPSSLKSAPRRAAGPRGSHHH